MRTTLFMTDANANGANPSHNAHDNGNWQGIERPLVMMSRRFKLFDEIHTHTTRWNQEDDSDGQM
jgi:hypothetical protein